MTPGANIDYPQTALLKTLAHEEIVRENRVFAMRSSFPRAVRWWSCEFPQQSDSKLLQGDAEDVHTC